jgi:hypothetical protein
MVKLNNKLLHFHRSDATPDLEDAEDYRATVSPASLQRAAVDEGVVLQLSATKPLGAFTQQCAEAVCANEVETVSKR